MFLHHLKNFSPSVSRTLNLRHYGNVFSLFVIINDIISQWLDKNTSKKSQIENTAKNLDKYITLTLLLCKTFENNFIIEMNFDRTFFKFFNFVF